MDAEQSEDVQAQLDRLNAAIAKTLEVARQSIATPRNLSNHSDSDISSSHSERIEYSQVDDAEDLYLFTEPGFHCQDSFGEEEKELIQALLLKLERTQMHLEDYYSRLSQPRSVPQVSVTQFTEVTKADIAAFREAISLLEKVGFAQFRLGEVWISARMRGLEAAGEEEDCILTRRAGEEHTETAIMMQVINQQSEALDAREREISARETAFAAEYSAFHAAKQRLELAAQQQTAQALSIKQRIEVLLHEQQSADLSSMLEVENHQGKDRCGQYEMEMESVRKLVGEMRKTGTDLSGVKKDIDLAEDILIRTLNGDDDRKFHLQLTIVKNKLVQIRSKQFTSEIEKMATSINSTISAFEASNLSQKTKNRIKESVLQKLNLPIDIPQRPTHNSRTRQLSMVQLSQPSALLSSVSHNRQSSLFLPPLQFQPDTDEQLKDAEVRCARLRAELKVAQARLEQYRSFERKLIETRAEVRIAAKELALYRRALQSRESRLAAREVELASKEDEKMQSAARFFSEEEAKEYLTLTAAQLAEVNQRLAKDLNSLEAHKAKLKHAKFAISEVRKTMEKEQSQLARDYTRLETERRKVEEAKNAVWELVQTA